ncbi:Coiled-coil domain-containing protein 47 [Geodia barretti]|nr:Coiled-coil domain-containing protein 47 [Geodia barretti]
MRMRVIHVVAIKCMTMAAFRPLVALLLLFLAAVVGAGRVKHAPLDREDDDFAEFDFDAEEEWDDGITVEEVIEEEGEEEDDEDMSVEDEEGGEGGEFEGIDDDEFEAGKSTPPLSKIHLSESAVRLQPVWLAYIGEILIGVSLLLYFINYMSGRSKNASLAQAWLDRHAGVLRSNFALVGEVQEEEGEGEEEEEEGEGDGKLIKESDDVYTVWASGRINCDNFLAQLKLLQRQDLLSLLLSFIWPKEDLVTIVMQLGEGDMDSIIMAIGQKKTLTKMQQEYEDLNRYCTPPRPAKRLGLDSDLQIVCEAPEVAQAVLNQQIVTFLNRYAHLLQSLHVSNEYTGFLPDADDSAEVTVIRKPQNRLEMTFKLGGIDDGDDIVRFALTLLDHVKTTRLTKEAKEKAQKNRNRVAQDKEKLQHQQRQEAAQARREDKKRMEKEKMMLEEDPEKARKWE